MKIFDKTLLLLITGAVLQAAVLYAEPEENFDDWGPYDWGCYTNSDNWVLYGGTIRTSTRWSAPVSPPHSGWLADIDDNTNSWVRSELLQYGVGLITYRCLDKAEGWNLFAIQYSTNAGVTWLTSSVVSNANNVETNWSYFTNRIDIIDPVYVRILKTDDGQFNQYLGLDDIVIHNAPGVEFSGLTNLPASPTAEDTVNIYVNIRFNPAASNFVLRSRYRIGDVGPYASRSLVNVSNKLYRMSNPIPAGYIGTVYYYVEAEYDGLGTSPVLYPLGGSENPRTYESTGGVAGTPDARPMGPCSRRTGLTISEIMYHPAECEDGRNLEFIEIFNSEPVDIDISGYKVKGDIDYTFPDGALVEGRNHLLVAKDPESVQLLYPVTMVYGPYDGSLSNGGGTVRLKNKWGALLLEVEYEDQMPWPIQADGGGHSLVLSKPDYGENDARAWSASARIGGSPGFAEYTFTNAPDNVVINEILAHTDLPQVDFIELYNYSTQSVDISGCILTDDPDTNRFIIPGDTILSPQSFVCYYQTNMGFSLNMEGSDVYLINSNKTYVMDAVRFNAQSNGVSIGRYPDGNPSLHLLTSLTPGETNSGLKTADIVISEIMFHPISGYDDDEYVELYNRSSNDVDVSYWRFTDGIDFRFAAGTVIPSEGYLVVAKNLTNLLAKYPQLNTTNTVGDYGGGLSDRGERLELARPDDIALPDQDFVVVDEVTYSDGWGTWVDGDGSSLELKDPRSDNRLKMNWEGSDETAKAPWTTIEYTGMVDNNSGSSMEELHILSPQYGECLVDEVEVIGVDGTNRVKNPSFDAGTSYWEFWGDHCRSSVEDDTGYPAGGKCLYVRASSVGQMTISTYRMTWDRVTTPLSSPMVLGETATIRGKARWLCGWPFIVFGVKGHCLEAAGMMMIPDNLGSPGQVNSRNMTNSGPAFAEVVHNPVVPDPLEDIVVTCRLADPDLVGSAQIEYRVDPATNYTTVSMNDSGVAGDENAGDGIWTRILPGQSSGALLAFRIKAVDLGTPAATNWFPAADITRNCLVRFGDPSWPGNLGVYRAWVSSTNVIAWISRPTRSDELVDMTFVYNDYRVIYSATVRYRGNWRNFGDYRNANYSIEFPLADRFLGDNGVSVDILSLQGSNGTLQQEHQSYWTAREAGIAAPYLRYVRVSVNGSSLFRHDHQNSVKSLCESWYNDEDPIAFQQLYPYEPFGNYTTGGEKKKAKYRYCMRKRAAGVPDDDYDALYTVVDAVANTDSARYIARVAAIADVRTWAGYFAINRVTRNFDHYTSASYPHNLCAYTPLSDYSRIHITDMDAAYSGSAMALFPPAGLIGGMFDKAPFKRIYWSLLKDIADGPLSPEKGGSYLDDWYAALAAEGLSPADPVLIKTPCAEAMSAIRAGMPAAEFEITSNSGNDFSTNQPVITLNGNAPIGIESFNLNGLSQRVTFTTVTAWNLVTELKPGTNVLVLEGYDREGTLVVNDTISITFTDTNASPGECIVINEIMYHPAALRGQYIELFNRSPVASFDLGGWRVNGADVTLDGGSVIGPTSFVVVAQSLPGYYTAYTNAEVVVDEFNGSLDNGGETISLLMPQVEGGMTNWVEIDRVKYDDDLPWSALADGQGCSLQLIDAARDNNRAGNWAVSTNRPFTPGEANSVSTNLPEFPTVWINEIMPTNMGFAADNNGEYEPWIELYNAGSNTVDLSAGNYYLTDRYTNLTKWAIPAGWTIASNGMLIVWADDETGETTNGYLHAGFRMNSESGCVALVRQPDSTPIIVDYVNYSSVPINYSYGKYPEGEQYSEVYMETATPGSVNTITSVPVNVYINEWMARNSFTITDPTDGKFEDWFELYNAGEDTVNLTGYTLTDDLTDTNQFTIPAGVTIGGREFMLVWADGDDEDNGPGVDLHVNFSLAAEGEEIGLYKPDGTLVDAVVFGAQEVDVTEGCWRDGNPDIYTLTTPTPGSSNILLIITSFMAPTGSVAKVTWSTEPGRKYRAEYITDLTGTNWVLMGIVTALTDSCWFDDTNVVGVPYKFYRLKRMD